MARRIDPEIQENVDRSEESEQGSADNDARKNDYNNGDGTKPSDAIKNANATGLGAIGRNDLKQTPYTSKDSTSAEGE